MQHAVEGLFLSLERLVERSTARRNHFGTRGPLMQRPVSQIGAQDQAAQAIPLLHPAFP